MIKWLRDKFASMITFFFVLSVILSTVSGGIGGFAVGKSFGYFNDYSGIGCIIGLIIGCFLGIICGILTFGFFATIVHISESIDKENENNQNNETLTKTIKCNNEEEKTSGVKKEIQILENGNWKCPICGSQNPPNDKTCYCGFKR